MRICSLLPSATEMIAELGLIDLLVGVPEECRWPRSGVQLRVRASGWSQVAPP
jgi:ABC-type hemin transport system substrate-binding protein